MPGWAPNGTESGTSTLNPRLGVGPSAVRLLEVVGINPTNPGLTLILESRICFLAFLDLGSRRPPSSIPHPDVQGFLRSVQFPGRQVCELKHVNAKVPDTGPTTYTDFTMGRSREDIQQPASAMDPLDEEIVVWNHKKEFALLLVGRPTCCKVSIYLQDRDDRLCALSTFAKCCSSSGPVSTPDPLQPLLGEKRSPRGQQPP